MKSVVHTVSLEEYFKTVGYQDSGTVEFCLWNLESWALECRIQLKKYGIPHTIGLLRYQ